MKTCTEATALDAQVNDIIELPIEVIVKDDSLNVRAGSIDLDVVDGYAEHLESTPPVEAFLVDGKHYLVDGWHRLYAAAKRKWTTIRVKIIGIGTLEEARDCADLANLRHGLNMTVAQKREIARRLRDRHSEWSNREIARQMGVTHPTIANWLVEDPKKPGKDLPPASVQDTAVATQAEGTEAAAANQGAAQPTQPTGQDVAPPQLDSPLPRTVQCPRCDLEFVPPHPGSKS